MKYHPVKSKSEINKYCPKESEIWDDCDACEGDPCQNGGHCQNTDNFRSCSKYRRPTGDESYFWVIFRSSYTVEIIKNTEKVSNVFVQKDSKVIGVKSMLFLIHVFLLHVSMEYVANVIQPINEPPAMKSQNIGVIVLLALKVIDVKYK